MADGKAANTRLCSRYVGMLYARGNNVRYICPQRICPDAPAKLFFRAAAPKLGVTMKVYADDKEIYSKKLIKINPGEMEHVEVTPEQMKGVSAIKIEVI